MTEQVDKYGDLRMPKDIFEDAVETRSALSKTMKFLYAKKMVEFKEVPNADDLFMILSPVLSRSIIVDASEGRPNVYFPEEMMAFAGNEYHTMTVIKDGLLLGCAPFFTGINTHFRIVLAMSPKHKAMLNDASELGIGVYRGNVKSPEFELLQIEKLNHNEKISGYKKRFTLLQTGNSLAGTKPKTFDEIGLEDDGLWLAEKLSKTDIRNLVEMTAALFSLTRDDAFKVFACSVDPKNFANQGA